VALMNAGAIVARDKPAALVAEHAGIETAEVFGPPARLAEVRGTAEAGGLHVRATGPAIAIVGSEKASNGEIPDDAVTRPASLEDVFVKLTGEELE
jgi:lipooligosaccharide transport system ATP-binding protein